MFSPSKQISDSTVTKATGKNWKSWFSILNKAGAKKMIHKDIAQMLWDKKLVKSGWWCQMVTVQYEKHMGRRVLGSTADVGFQVGVQKTFPLSAKAAWKFIMSPRAIAIWLGKGAKLAFKKGHMYQTTDGTRGEVRTISPGKKLRFTWRPKKWKQSSTIQIYVESNGKKSTISFHQEKLASAKVRAQMKTHWQRILEKLERAL